MRSPFKAMAAKTRKQIKVMKPSPEAGSYLASIIELGQVLTLKPNLKLATYAVKQNIHIELSTTASLYISKCVIVEVLGSSSRICG